MVIRWTLMRPAFLLALSEVVLHLHAEPYLRAAAEGLGKPYGHFRGDSGLAINKVVEGLVLDAKTLRRIRNGKTERLDALLPDNPAGMRGVLHSHDNAWYLPGAHLWCIVKEASGPDFRPGIGSLLGTATATLYADRYRDRHCNGDHSGDSDA